MVSWRFIIFRHILCNACLDMYLDIFISADGAAILYPLDERVPGPVVCDGEAQRVLRLDDLDLLPVSLPVGEDEVVQPDLAAQQVAHVHLVGVQGAEQDLEIQPKG